VSDNSQAFHLDQLYLALTNPDSKTPTVQVLARTPGVRPEHVVECRRVSPMLPPLRTPNMPSALGIFRGETIDYVIAKVQAGPGNILLAHYVLAPASMMRQLGGNLHLLEPFGVTPIPMEQRSDLSLFALDGVRPPTTDAQADDLLLLIGYCKNNLKTVGNLLAGIVQGMGLAVLNAPPSLRDRLNFVQGLLTLLPAPARVAITFATTVSDPANSPAQIKFLSAEVPLEKHLIFDWATGKLRNDAPEDTYAKFILAQLRLDTSLVIEQTEKLARTAVWRAMRRETMANALAWASKRASLDSAVDGGLPADRVMVAAVLREDPTLPDDMRVAYSKHLLALSLALNDPANTEIIPALAVQNKEIADAIYEQLWSAAGGENANAVYNIVERWIGQAPVGMDISRWRPLLGMSLMARANTMLTGDGETLLAFLKGLLVAPPSLQLDNVVAQIIGICRKRAYDNPAIAQVIFLLAVTYLPLGGLQRLLADQVLVGQFPPTLRSALLSMMPNSPKMSPPGLLATASEVYGTEHQPIILGRLSEWALTMQRLDMMDVNALRGLLQVAISSYGDRFDNLIQHIVQDLSHLNILKAQRTDIQRYLIELSLARRRYDGAVMQLAVYQDMLYQNQRQDEVSEVARAVFKEVPLDTKAMLMAIEFVQKSSGLKPSVRANALIGALEAKQWSNEMEPVARNLTALLYDDPRLIAMIGRDPAMQLLKANSERRDEMESLRAAHALIAYALTFQETETGPELIDQVYSLVNWDPKVAQEALEIVRDYVRQAAPGPASVMPSVFASKYGESVRVALDTSYRMRLVLGGTDFGAFYDEVTAAAHLLIDFAVFYAEGRDVPQIFKLQRNVQSIPGGLTEPERARLAQNLNKMAEQILRLYAIHQMRIGKRSRSDVEARKLGLVKGKTSPADGVEVLSWMSGQLGEGQQFTVNLNREAAAYLLGTRSLNIFVRETDLIVRVFDGLLSAFPSDNPGEIDRAAWATEVNFVWGLISLYRQREIQASLIEALQHLSQILVLVGEKGNPRSLQATGVGQQLYIGKAMPRSVIDVLRWLSGYFAHEHVNSPARD